MKRALAFAVLAGVLSFGGARGEPLACGGVQTRTGTMTCQIDATSSTGQVSAEFGFFALSAPGSTTTNRLEVVDSRGRIRYATENHQSEGTLFAGGVTDPLPSGMYTCRLVTSGTPTAIAFNCALV